MSEPRTVKYTNHAYRHSLHTHMTAKVKRYGWLNPLRNLQLITSIYILRATLITFRFIILEQAEVGLEKGDSFAMG